MYYCEHQCKKIYKYTVIKVIGKYVAIKKMLQLFRSPTHAKRTYRELKLLMYLNHPDAQVCRNESFGFFNCSLNFFFEDSTIIQCIHT